jgi:hypothetical protein
MQFQTQSCKNAIRRGRCIRKVARVITQRNAHIVSVSECLYETIIDWNIFLMTIYAIEYKHSITILAIFFKVICQILNGFCGAYLDITLASGTTGSLLSNTNAYLMK